MRLVMLIGTLVLLVGCTSDPVLLRHSKTGKTVKCGPYPTFHFPDKAAAVQRERGCIEDYQRQGYERVMDSLGETSNPMKGDIERALDRHVKDALFCFKAQNIDINRTITKASHQRTRTIVERMHGRARMDNCRSSW